MARKNHSGNNSPSTAAESADVHVTGHVEHNEPHVETAEIEAIYGLAKRGALAAGGCAGALAVLCGATMLFYPEFLTPNQAICGSALERDLVGIVRFSLILALACGACIIWPQHGLERLSDSIASIGGSDAMAPAPMTLALVVALAITCIMLLVDGLQGLMLLGFYPVCRFYVPGLYALLEFACLVVLFIVGVLVHMVWRAKQYNPKISTMDVVTCGLWGLGKHLVVVSRQGLGCSWDCIRGAAVRMWRNVVRLYRRLLHGQGHENEHLIEH